MSNEKNARYSAEDLDNLIFYSVDKASPYALALYDETNSLSKILKFRFTELAMTNQGVALMWLHINAGLGQLGAKSVNPAAAAKTKVVEDVKVAVYSANPGA